MTIGLISPMARISADRYTTAAFQIVASRQDSAYDFRLERHQDACKLHMASNPQMAFRDISGWQ